MITDLLKKRCSVRNFTEKPIKEDILNDILESGRLSPSGGNEQSWQFGVITDPKLIESISKHSYHQDWIKTAPLLIVMCTMVVDDERGGRTIQKKRFPRFSNEIDELDWDFYAALNMEEHQTKIPGTHMMLAALEHNIYSTWVSYFDVHKVSSLLRLPVDIIASEIIAFGYAENTKKKRSKKSLEQIVFYDEYSEGSNEDDEL